MPRWRQPCDARGRCRIWKFPTQVHKYNPKGPHLSLYSELEANKKKPEHEEYWSYVHWKIAGATRQDKRNFKYERSTGNTYTKRPLDDWFEPGTPRQ